MFNFVDKGADLDILKSISTPQSEEELVKAMDKSKLVQKEIVVQTKHGMVRRKQWVKATETDDKSKSTTIPQKAIKGAFMDELLNNLKKTGIEMEGADAYDCKHSSRPPKSVTLYTKDGKTLTATFNKYSDGGVEVLNFKEVAPPPTTNSVSDKQMKEYKRVLAIYRIDENASEDEIKEAIQTAQTEFQNFNNASIKYAKKFGLNNQRAKEYLDEALDCKKDKETLEEFLKLKQSGRIQQSKKISSDEAISRLNTMMQLVKPNSWEHTTIKELQSAIETGKSQSNNEFEDIVGNTIKDLKHYYKYSNSKGQLYIDKIVEDMYNFDTKAKADNAQNTTDNKSKQNAKSTTSTSSTDPKSKMQELTKGMSPKETIKFAKDNGITWKENDHEGINLMRAKMAITKAVKEGKFNK